MVTKTKAKSKTRGNEYVIVHPTKGRSRGQTTITAKNIQEAYAKAGLLFPKAKFITVSRRPSRKGQEYETYVISRK